MIPYHEHVDEGVNGYLNCSSYIAMKQIHSLVPLLLLLVGTLGNALSLMVLTRRSMRKLSIYNYLAVLSVVDTLVLYSGVLPEWLENLYGYTITQAWLCKLKNVVKYTVSQFSVWIIVSVTVERYIATAHTLSAARMCTRKRALAVMLCLFTLLLLMNGHLLFTSTIRFYNMTYGDDGSMVYTKYQCVLTQDPYIIRIWPWVDTCFYSFLPFLVILTLNILIIRTVHHSETQRNRLGRIMSAESVVSRRESEAKLTRLLMTISFMFLVTTLPVNIVWIVGAIIKSYLSTPCQVSHFFLAMVVGRMLMYTNHSCNFFLYLFSGIKFRQKLFSMIFNACTKLKNTGQHVYGRMTITSHTENTATTSV